MPRWTCGFYVLCILAAIAADQEPSYNGRLLSEWLADVRPSLRFRLVVGAPFPPRDAICAMGTNAIPSLLQWISYERSPSDKFPRARELPHWRWHTLNPEELADTAPSAFGYLGTIARPIIPELTRLARESSEPERARRCAAALAGIGPEAIPSLISLVTNSPPWTRWYALGQLESFVRDPAVATALVPMLMNCLSENDTNTDYAVTGPAERILVAMDPKVVVPALTNALQSASVFTRQRAIVCLLGFEAEKPTNVPPTAVPALRAAMRDPDSVVRDVATSILRDMGGWERVGEEWVRRYGTNTLNGITPDFFTNAPPR